MEIIIPETIFYNNKLLRQWRVVESAVDGLHMQRELDHISEKFDSMDEFQKQRATIRKLKLVHMLNNCDAFLKSALAIEPVGT